MNILKASKSQCHFSDGQYMCHFQRPEDLWAVHSQPVFPKPHKRESAAWTAIRKVLYWVSYLAIDIISLRI